MATHAIPTPLLAAKAPGRPIGELLVAAGRLSQQDVHQVLAVQRQQGGRFGDTARALGLIDEADVRLALAQCGYSPCQTPARHGCQNQSGFGTPSFSQKRASQ